MGPYDDDYADDYDDSMNYYDHTMEDLIASEYNYGNSDLSDGIDTDMDYEDDY